MYTLVPSHWNPYVILTLFPLFCYIRIQGYSSELKPFPARSYIQDKLAVQRENSDHCVRENTQHQPFRTWMKGFNKAW